jgi:hypothetical protein
MKTISSIPSFHFKIVNFKHLSLQSIDCESLESSGMGKNGHVKCIELEGLELLEAHTNCFEWFKKIVCRNRGTIQAYPCHQRGLQQKKKEG